MKKGLNCHNKARLALPRRAMAVGPLTGKLPIPPRSAPRDDGSGSPTPPCQSGYHGVTARARLGAQTQSEDASVSLPLIARVRWSRRRVRSRERWSLGELQAHQAAELAALRRIAVRRSDFYRTLHDPPDSGPGADLPLVNKVMLMDHTASFPAVACRASEPRLGRRCQVIDRGDDRALQPGCCLGM